MSMNIEKIKVSQFAPESTDLAWYNPQTRELRFFTNGEWALVAGSGGGEGGAGNLLVGTKEDREALTPYNGLEFNQVEEDGTVHMYLYEHDEWTLLVNPDAHDSEEVIIMLSDNTGEIDFSKITVQVTNHDTGVVHDVEIDSTGEGIIYIPIGEEYTVTYPVIEGYNPINSVTYTAERYVRQLNAVYRIISTGVTYTLEASTDPTVPIDEGSDLTSINRILNPENNPGSYIIDEVHKVYARLDPEDHSKFIDGTNWSGTYGNAFRHMGKAYLLKNNAYVGSGTQYNISDTTQGESGVYEIPETWTGIYLGSVVGGALVSRPNLTPTRSITIAQAQSYAQGNGSTYSIDDYYAWVKRCHLFAAKYGTRDSQTTIGMGMTKNPAETTQSYKEQLFATSTGYTAGLGDDSGEMGNITVNGHTYHQCKLFGIEAPWGQNWQFLKGIRFNGSTAYVCDALTIANNTPASRTFTRHTSLSSTYLNNMVLGAYGDMMGSPNNVAGDSAHGYCDASWSANGENTLFVGSHSAGGLFAGLFSSSSATAFSYSDATSGARLSFYGDISQYQLISGADMAALNS